MLVDKPARHVLAVQLAHRRDDLGQLVPEPAAQAVAVGVEPPELVVAPQRLVLVEGLAHLLWVEHRHVGERRLVGQRLRAAALDLGGGQGGVALVVLIDRHVAQPVGGARRVDVALDVGRLSRQLRGAHSQSLVGGRVDTADQHPHQSPDHHRHDRQGPASLADVPQEQGRGDHRDGDQQELGRDLGVHPRRGGTVDQVLAGQDDLQALEVVVHPLDQRQDPEQHRHMGLDRRRRALRGGLEPYPAVQVVGDGGHDQHHDDGEEHPVQQPLDERELEDVEADVLVELGVGGLKVDVVAEQIPVVPLLVGAHPGEEGEDNGGDDADQSSPLGVDLAVPLHQVVLRSDGRHIRRHPVGDGQAAEQHDEEDDDEDRAQGDLGEQHAAEHRGEVHLREPQVVGPEASQSPERGQQQDRHHDDGQNTDPEAAGGARQTAGKIRGGSHAKGEPIGGWSPALAPP